MTLMATKKLPFEETTMMQQCFKMPTASVAGKGLRAPDSKSDTQGGCLFDTSNGPAAKTAIVSPLSGSQIDNQRRRRPAGFPDFPWCNKGLAKNVGCHPLVLPKPYTSVGISVSS